MPKPACIKCQRFFRPKKNGYVLTEMKPTSYMAEPGKQTPELWEPYKVWRCDLYECEGCGHQIAVGYGHDPSSQDYLPDFKEEVLMSDSLVNDC